MPLFRRRSARSARSAQDKQRAKLPVIPEGVQAAARLDPRERVLAAAQDDHTGGWVLISSWRLLVVAPGVPNDAGSAVRLTVDRRWLDVDGGSWDPDTGSLSLSWVGGGAGLQWQFLERTGPGRVPEAFRERVSASIVLMRHLDLGPRRTARVAIREDLRDRSLIEQVLPGKGVRADDAELARELETARVELRDQVGLPPA